VPVPELVLRELGLVDYEPTPAAMQQFTDTRNADSPDELWLLQHPRVFTQGQAGKAEHVLAAGDIPVVQADRGGQVTYHGPGQLMIYPLIDLKRSRLGVRDLVTALERTVVDVAADLDIEAIARADAPGVYVDGRKLASVGLRVRRGASYHGMALNIDLDLEPFSRINPCGFSDLEVTDLTTLGVTADRGQIQARIQDKLLRHLQLHGKRIVSDY